MNSLWNNLSIKEYLQTNYAKPHREDVLIIEKLAAFYQRIPHLTSGIEIGAGPNLYPILAMIPKVAHIVITDISTKSSHYLKRQQQYMSPIWQQYWQTLQKFSSLYSSINPQRALARATIKQQDLLKSTVVQYELASMHFCADAISKTSQDFINASISFTKLVKPNGYLIASFMENSQEFSIAKKRYTTIKVTQELLHQAFGHITNNLSISRIPKSDPPIRDGYSGVLFLTAQRK